MRRPKRVEVIQDKIRRRKNVQRWQKLMVKRDIQHKFKKRQWMRKIKGQEEEEGGGAEDQKEGQDSVNEKGQSGKIQMPLKPRRRKRFLRQQQQQQQQQQLGRQLGSPEFDFQAFQQQLALRKRKRTMGQTESSSGTASQEDTPKQ